MPAPTIPYPLKKTKKTLPRSREGTTLARGSLLVQGTKLRVPDLSLEIFSIHLAKSTSKSWLWQSATRKSLHILCNYWNTLRFHLSIKWYCHLMQCVPHIIVKLYWNNKDENDLNSKITKQIKWKKKKRSIMSYTIASKESLSSYFYFVAQLRYKVLSKLQNMAIQIYM